MRRPEPSAVDAAARPLPALPGPWPPRTRWPEPLHRAVAALRGVLEAWRAESGPGALVALSGGADSLALTVTAAVLRHTRAGEDLGPVGAVVVDHGLQPGSAAVAEAAAGVARALGLHPVTVAHVDVRPTGDGPEADARHARRAALVRAATPATPGPTAPVRDPDASPDVPVRDADASPSTPARDPHATPALVLTAHTADDQAEQVLLGLARGSGTRSLAGIPPRGVLPGGVAVARPLLGLTRADTEAICRWAGVAWWTDPHNADPAYLRSRVRTRILPALEDDDAGLGPGVRAALARTAALAAEDADALDAWADTAFGDARLDGGGSPADPLALDLDALAALPAAVRRRVLARAAVAVGAHAPTRERILAVDALVTGAHTGGSAGPVELPGGVRAHRVRGRRPTSERRPDPVPDPGWGRVRTGACDRLELIPAAPAPDVAPRP